MIPIRKHLVFIVFSKLLFQIIPVINILLERVNWEYLPTQVGINLPALSTDYTALWVGVPNELEQRDAATGKLLRVVPANRWFASP